MCLDSIPSDDTQTYIFYVFVIIFFRQKDLIPSTNKQFLQRTIASSLFRSKQVKDDKRKNTNKSSNNQPKSILLPIADDKSKEVKKELKSNDKSVLKSNKRKQNVSNDCIISSKKTK